MRVNQLVRQPWPYGSPGDLPVPMKAALKGASHYPELADHPPAPDATDHAESP